jgi:hypothetical protein
MGYMPTSSASLGVLLILAGALLFGAWVYVCWYPGPPLEEPANLGKTPNPSAVPWIYDREKEEREYRLDRWKRGFFFYGMPGAGLILAALGVVTLAGRKKA